MSAGAANLAHLHAWSVQASIEFAGLGISDRAVLRAGGTARLEHFVGGALLLLGGEGRDGHGDGQKAGNGEDELVHG